MRGGASPAALADLLFVVETDRAYADGGHSLDFINKAFLIAVARYLAAHFPTQRALLQTADISRRLMHGGELHRKAQAG